MPTQNTNTAKRRNVVVKVTFNRTFVSGPLKGYTLPMSNNLPMRKALKFWANEYSRYRDRDGNMGCDSGVKLHFDKAARRAFPRVVVTLTDFQRIRQAS